jgi:DNA-binding response OmpR family regulator
MHEVRDDRISETVKRVLIVDDEETLLFAMARYFRRLGCQVVTAGEKEEAQALLGKRRFDLVILDLALTSWGAEGLDVLSELRYASAGTAVIVLSALVGPDIEADALRRGADAVLTKPQPLAEVARVAVRIMRRKQ